MVEPLAAVDVNPPGLMVMPVTPPVTQLRVLLAPALMLEGLAVNEVIVGFVPSDAVTVTVAVLVTDPALLVAVSVYAVVADGDAVVEPLAASRSESTRADRDACRAAGGPTQGGARTSTYARRTRRELADCRGGAGIRGGRFRYPGTTCEEHRQNHQSQESKKMELQRSTERESTRNGPLLQLFLFGTRRHGNQPTGVEIGFLLATGTGLDHCHERTGRRPAHRV